MSDVYRVFGVESSPYTLKVRAVLRYRRIPNHWLARFPFMVPETAHVRPRIMPVVQFPDGTYWTDSTPIVEEIERRHPGPRSILPEDPCAAFLCYLIEDMADEWLAKCLFFYRFSHEEDGHFAARWVMSDAKPASTREALEEDVRWFRERQISRRPLVGTEEKNRELLERSYGRILDALESFVGNERYLLGTRPSLADFGLYGSLKPLATDPTALSVMRERAPFTEHWTRRIDDASGVEGEWTGLDANPGALRALLALCGDTYLPFLRANAEAIAEDREMLSVELSGSKCEQPVFRYQERCYRVLRRRFSELAEQDRQRLRGLLEETSCWSYLNS